MLKNTAFDSLQLVKGEDRMANEWLKNLVKDIEVLGDWEDKSLVECSRLAREAITNQDRDMVCGQRKIGTGFTVVSAAIKAKRPSTPCKSPNASKWACRGCLRVNECK